MTLRHFQIFVAVCDHKNMTAAASTMFMSQPAVSQAVSELEEYYNVRLFERLSKKLYLTQAGEKLLSYARHIIGLNAAAENEMRALSESGRLRIGASVTVGSCVLPKLVADFSKVFPGLKIEVTEDNTSKIEQLIINDKLDLGLVEGEITSQDIISRPMADDILVLICGAGHPLATRNSIEPYELEKENFILREIGSGTRKTFEDVMAENSLKWTATWTCNNTDTIKMAVAEGLGISVISKRAVSKEIEEGILKVINVNGLYFKRQFKLIHHKNKYLTEAIKKFTKVCLQNQ
ncbi:LysR family transcriptional regulator [Anaerocolumna xylanovorans]|uniref:DNA-binding transcriptional regulator, LysR family n=1 Tax=Anaerocolumna xylanovorans DSM 12503 TaxID=1121345 RepID=A0A1M7XWP9_9FIRM|nr:LysR family transcriptional regulator [Anaerocolumna xylanovorans]SHO43218.1 DNA-binding transcriptional regulator, LysR family [Anaerocolumna xylanovorans DSM 12503]